MFKMTATESGDVTSVLSLLSSGASVNEEDEAGHTSLSLAMRKSDQTISMALLQWGASVNILDKSGKPLAEVYPSVRKCFILFYCFIVSLFHCFLFYILYTLYSNN